jgi:hypothetical protein
MHWSAALCDADFLHTYITRTRMRLKALADGVFGFPPELRVVVVVCWSRIIVECNSFYSLILRILWMGVFTLLFIIYVFNITF